MTQSSTDHFAVLLTHRSGGPIVRRLVDQQGWLSSVWGAWRENGLWGALDKLAVWIRLFPTACRTGAAFGYDADNSTMRTCHGDR
jgi:hypothetical protein